MERTGEDIMEKARRTEKRPGHRCPVHAKTVSGCRHCADSYVDEVAWLLAHPDEMDKPVPPERPALDPTPCGICGSVIGEGLMTLHIAACHGPAI